MLRSICFLYIALTCMKANGQCLFQTLKPALFSSYQAGLSLDSNSFRFLALSRPSSHGSFQNTLILDWNVEDDSFQISSPTVPPWNIPVLYANYELKILPFANGDCIIMGNSFDCDAAPPVVVMYLNKNGSIKWHNLEDDQNELYYGDSLGLVNANVVAVFSANGNNLYYTFDGLRVEYTSPPPLYTSAYVDTNAYFGFREGKYFKLNKLFEEISSYPIDTIYVFQPLGVNSFLLSGKNEMILLDSNLQVKSTTSLLSAVTSVTKTGSLIYAVAGNQLFVMDTALQIIEVYPPVPAEKMRMVHSNDDSVMVISQYHGLNHDDLVARKYKYDQKYTIPNTNLVFQSVEVPDTVLIKYPVGQFGGFVFCFDTISFHLYNDGSDTIKSFDLRLDWSSILGFCDYYKDQWHMDGISIPPQGYYDFQLIDYRTDTTGLYLHGPYCFWVEMPNGLPDQSPEDDKACESAVLYLGVQDLVSSDEVVLYPNPVSDFLTIQTEYIPALNRRCKIYSYAGNLVDEFNVNESSYLYSVSGLLPGLYCIFISDQFGRFSNRNFVVAY